MNTSKLRIWGFEKSDAELRNARESGWSKADLTWERLLESAIGHWMNGHGLRSQFQFRRALSLAKKNFDKMDLRIATCHVNLALVYQSRKRNRLALSHQNQALEIWKNADCQIDAMTIKPRARSSLFHLRMEARNRDQFRQNVQNRIRLIAGETLETINCSASDHDSSHRHFSRWKGEKPAVFDDTRKVLGACLLIIDK